MAQVEICESSEAASIAERYIRDYHPHLIDARILYLLTSQKRSRAGKTVLGSAAKLAALPRYLSSGTSAAVEEGYDFLILIGADEWEHLTGAQREALIDHELCHCQDVASPDDDEPKWALRGHDVEEFRCVIERHGLWKPDVQAFGKTIEQLPFREMEANRRGGLEAMEGLAEARKVAAVGR